METFLYDLLLCFILGKCCKNRGQEQIKTHRVRFQQLILKTSANKANIAVVCKYLPDEDDEGLFL